MPVTVASNRPPWASCSTHAHSTHGTAYETNTLPYGARSSQPDSPSPSPRSGGTRVRPGVCGPPVLIAVDGDHAAVAADPAGDRGGHAAPLPASRPRCPALTSSSRSRPAVIRTVLDIDVIIPPDRAHAREAIRRCAGSAHSPAHRAAPRGHQAQHSPARPTAASAPPRDGRAGHHARGPGPAFLLQPGNHRRPHGIRIHRDARLGRPGSRTRAHQRAFGPRPTAAAQARAPRCSPSHWDSSVVTW